MVTVADKIAGTEGHGRYRALVLRRLLLIGGLCIALFLSVAIDMALGPANYTLSDVLKALFQSVRSAISFGLLSGISACPLL